LFERPEEGENAILVAVSFNYAEQHDLAEFSELAKSAGATVLEVVQARRVAPHPRFFIGTGKVEELTELISSTGADLVLFDHQLSPAQERNLEGALNCRVVDRTRLILDIFAQRARSFEGKLQVELASTRVWIRCARNASRAQKRDVARCSPWHLLSVIRMPANQHYSMC